MNRLIQEARKEVRVPLWQLVVLVLAFWLVVFAAASR